MQCKIPPMVVFQQVGCIFVFQYSMLLKLICNFKYVFKNLAQKMKELKVTPIKDVNPMINNMAIKGRCISIWHSHKLNEEHDPYSLDCVFQDVEVYIFIFI